MEKMFLRAHDVTPIADTSRGNGLLKWWPSTDAAVTPREAEEEPAPLKLITTATIFSSVADDH
jgi:hypothetical protein